MTICEMIRDYVLGALEAPASLSDDASLFEGGFLGPEGLAQMITFLEESYILEIPESDVRPENFESIAKIAVYVDRKLADLDTSRAVSLWMPEAAGAPGWGAGSLEPPAV